MLHSCSVVAWFTLLGQANMESSAEAGGFIQTPTCLLKNPQHPGYSMFLLPSNRPGLERERERERERESERKGIMDVYVYPRLSGRANTLGCLFLPCEQLTLSTTSLPCNGAQYYTPRVLPRRRINPVTPHTERTPLRISQRYLSRG